MEHKIATNYPKESLISLCTSRLAITHNIFRSWCRHYSVTKFKSTKTMQRNQSKRVVNLQQSKLEAKILTGCSAGNSVCIPMMGNHS